MQEQDRRSLCGCYRRCRPANSAKDYDCMRNYLWTTTDNVVTGVPSRSRRNETDRHANDRRRYYLGDSQPLDLSGHLRDLEEALTSFRASHSTVYRPAGL